MIRQTGIAVVQVPSGVEWNPGEQVRLVVGIAAASDEHLQILANLTQVLADADEVERLSTTSDPAVLVDRLTRVGDTQTPTGGAMDERLEGYASADVVVEGASGLHARPATFFVDVAKGFQAEVRVRHDGKVVNGKSLASLLSLGADAGSTLTLLASGPDEEEALRALQDAVASGLGEEEEEADEAPSRCRSGGPRVLPSACPGSRPRRGLRSARCGTSSGGAGRGAHRQRPAAEEGKLRSGIESARAELRDLYEEVKAKSGAGKASIFRAHEAFLDDPDLEREALAAIRTGTSAGWSWREVINARAEELSKVEDPLVAARAVDLRDVGQRVLRFLAESDDAEAQLPDHPVILIAEDLAPSDTAAIDPARVVGFATALGGGTSHTAIIARALGIPAMVGAGPALLNQNQDEVAVLDGQTGTLWLHLGEEDLASGGRCPARHRGPARPRVPDALPAGDHARWAPRRGGGEHRRSRGGGGRGGGGR